MLGAERFNNSLIPITPEALNYNLERYQNKMINHKSQGAIAEYAAHLISYLKNCSRTPWKENIKWVHN